MKLIIAGSRHITVAFHEMCGILKEKLGDNWRQMVDEIVSGNAPGVDRSGDNFSSNSYIKCTRFPANWIKYGKAAGSTRNLEMAIYADALLLIWDGKSRGSANMKARMNGMGKPIYEVIKHV